jgi:hypothetical protein
VRSGSEMFQVLPRNLGPLFSLLLVHSRIPRP